MTFGIKIDSEIASRKATAAKIVIECHSGFHQGAQPSWRCVQPVGNPRRCLRVGLVPWRRDSGKGKGPVRNYLKLPATRVP